METKDNIEIVEQVIAIYESIPDENWCTGTYTSKEGKHCAIGHLLDHHYRLEVELGIILNPFQVYLPDVNDGVVKEYQQATPKLRSIAALKDVIIKLKEHDTNQRTTTSQDT